MSEDDLSEEMVSYLTTDDSYLSTLETAARKRAVRAKNGLQARYAGLKASLSPGTHVPSQLLQLPAEIRNMIWNIVSRDGYFVLHVHAGGKEKDMETRRKNIESTPQKLRDSLEFKKLPHTKFCLRRSPNGFRIELLLVCKQMQCEITAAYFRDRTIEVRKSADWAGKFHRTTFFPIKGPRTIDIMANVRHLSTFVRVHPLFSWQHNVQENAWFLRLLRLCPQIRSVRMTMHWWPFPRVHISAIDPHREDLRILIPPQVQLVFSKALELMPIVPDSTDGPRLTRASPLDRYHTCDLSEEDKCLCTWTATFHFVPSNDPRIGPGADFHDPAVDDWSNQILFNHRLKRNKNARRNLLERQIGPDMRRPRVLLPLNHKRPPAKEETMYLCPRLLVDLSFYGLY